MADYWISQPRHFCEFCRCWIADNKPSREFHERGKNHQQNVQKKISETLKKSRVEAAKKEEFDQTMKNIEEAALKSLKKDLRQDPSLASTYGVKIKTKQADDTAAVLPKKDNHDISKKSSEKNIKLKPEQSAKDPNLLWKEEWTPEGFVYYWHTETGESVWVKPEGYVPTWERAAKEMLQKEETLEIEPLTAAEKEQSTEEPQTTDQSESLANAFDQSENVVDAVDQSENVVDAAYQSEPSKTEFFVIDQEPVAVCDIPLPDSVTSAKSESEEVTSQDDEESGDSGTVSQPGSAGTLMGPMTKSQAHTRAAGAAYGAWETVPEPIEHPPIDLQLPTRAELVEVKSIPISEPKIKFRQKKVDTLGAEFVAFKKRKIAAGQKQSVRKTDTEKDC